MTANTSWKRVAALVLAMLVAHAPSAFAGRLLDSALERAASVTAARPAAHDAAVLAGASAPLGAEARAAATQGRGDGGGGMRQRNVWALIGAGVAIGLIMMKIDRTVEDSTPSTRRERRDGCTLFCS